MFLAAICRSEGAAVRDPALAWACWILTILWLGAPFMQFDAQRNLDLNGMRLLPVSRNVFTMAVMLDAALSPLGLFYALALILALIAFALSVAEALVLAAVLLVLSLCWLALGQSIYLWANRLLASRRFTDVSLVVGVTLVVGIQFVNLAFNTGDDLELPGWLSRGLAGAWAVGAPLARWLFPGVAAQVVAAAGQGHWLAVLGQLGLLVLQAGVCFELLAIAVRQFYEGELESSGPVMAPKRVRSGGDGGLSQILAGATGAIFHRERLYLWRDPMVKMMLLQSLFGAAYFIFAAVMFKVRGHGLAADFSKYAVLLMAMLLSYMESGSLFKQVRL